MAEGFINGRYSDRYEAYSAGNEPTEVHPCAVEVMAEEGINISTQRAKSLDEFDDASFDYVATMCADATETCPIFPGGAEFLQHAFFDPVSAEADEQDKCRRFRQVRDQIMGWLAATFGDGSARD